MYKTITIDSHEGFTVLSLNNPDTLNAMSPTMIGETIEAIENIKNDENCRALVLTGCGKNFSSGVDLKEATNSKDGTFPDVEKELQNGFNKLVLIIKNLSIPTVAAVNGACAGAGMGVALSTDIVIASKDAYFLQAFIHIGLIPDAGCTWFLPHLVGAAKAKAMMMLGEKIPASEAERMGLIYKVVESDDLTDVVENLAKKLAKGPTNTYKLLKEVTINSQKNTLEEQLSIEAATQKQASQSEDFVEGIQAFVQKRKPQFKGK